MLQVGNWQSMYLFEAGTAGRWRRWSRCWLPRLPPTSGTSILTSERLDFGHPSPFRLPAWRCSARRLGEGAPSGGWRQLRIGIAPCSRGGADHGGAVESNAPPRRSGSSSPRWLGGADAASLSRWWRYVGAGSCCRSRTYGSHSAGTGHAGNGQRSAADSAVRGWCRWPAWQADAARRRSIHCALGRRSHILDPDPRSARSIDAAPPTRRRWRCIWSQSLIAFAALYFMGPTCWIRHAPPVCRGLQSWVSFSALFQHHPVARQAGSALLGRSRSCASSIRMRWWSRDQATDPFDAGRLQALGGALRAGC